MHSVQRELTLTLCVKFHFCWLLCFFWMSVCSFYVFRVFSTLSKPNPSANKWRLTMKYLLYSLLCTSAVIGINVAVTYHIKDGTIYGYGPDKTGMCYIYDPLMIIYTMAIPAYVIVFANIIMFSVTAVNMRKCATLHKQVQTERNYFSIYARLSMITGITWVFGIPMIFIKSALLSYMFIVLICCQGLYVFIAFTCNKRVVKLYSDNLSQ